MLGVEVVFAVLYCANHLSLIGVLESFSVDTAIGLEEGGHSIFFAVSMSKVAYVRHRI